MAKNTRARGDKGEQIVAEYLLKKNITIVERNYRCYRGEIDIIISPCSGCLAFVEVKSRSSTKCGYPIEAVTSGKRARIIRSAKCYLLEKGLYGNVDVRFDIAEVYDDSVAVRVEYYENAFIEGD